MRFITDRQEIAREINIKKTPVITMDISKEKPGWEGHGVYEGSKILASAGDGVDARCTAMMFREGDNEGIENPWEYKAIHLSSGGICISNSFGRSDVMEMVEWSNCRTVEEGDDVIVVFDDSEKGVCYIRKMRVGRVSKFCYTAAVLRDVDE